MVPARMVKRFRPSSYSAELCSAAGTRVISLILLMMLLALGAAGLQGSSQSAQQSEYEGHCYAGSLDRRPTSSVATDILANDRPGFAEPGNGTAETGEQQFGHGSIVQSPGFARRRERGNMPRYMVERSF